MLQIDGGGAVCGRGGGYDGEDGAVMFRAELDAFSQHKAIVVRLTGEMQARFYALSSRPLSRANARASRGTLRRAAACLLPGWGFRCVDMARCIFEPARSQVLPSRIESRDQP